MYSVYVLVNARHSFLVCIYDKITLNMSSLKLDKHITQGRHQVSKIPYNIIQRTKFEVEIFIQRGALDAETRQESQPNIR